MSRKISAEFRSHLSQVVTTTCRLLLIILKDGRRFGLTSLDRDVEYLGVVYSAANGFDSFDISTDTGMSVDNSEVEALLAGDIPGITVDMVYSGELDDARYIYYLVNYEDLSMGDVILGAGDVGEVNVTNGVIYVPELIDYVMRLRQSIGSFWSRTCRAEFGSPDGTHTGCGVNAEALWQPGTVTGISDEPTRVFADSGLVLDPVPNTARVQWLTGPNSGSRLYQVEGFGEITGTISLVEPVPFRIEPGHQFRIRPDCDKTPASCKRYGNWPLGYKGEPLIPSGEGIALLTPSSGVPGGFQGSEVIE